MLTDFNNLSIIALHKLIVTKGNILNNLYVIYILLGDQFYPKNESIITLSNNLNLWTKNNAFISVIEKLIIDIQVLIETHNINIDAKNSCKQINCALQILYKLSSYICNNNDAFSQEFLQIFSEHILTVSTLFSSIFTLNAI